MVTQLINVIVNSKGAVTVKKQLNDIGDTAQKTSTYLNSLRTILAGALAFSGIGAITETVNTFVQLQNRLKLVSSSADEVTQSWSKLVEIANSSYSTIDSTVSLYYRVALAYQQWGESADKAMKFTELFQKAAILSGSTMQTTSQAVYQFTQALNKGKLDGDEFRSVLEGLPYVATILQNSLGVTRKELYAMSKAGEITVDKVKEAFESSSADIQKAWKNITPTIGMAIAVLKNNWVDFVGEIQTSTGAFTGIAYIILGIADNFGTLAAILSPVAASLAFLAGRMVIGLVVLGFKEMMDVTKAIIPVLTALNTVLWANPYVLLAAAIVAVVAAIVYFRNELGLTNEFLTQVWTTVSSFFAGLATLLQPVISLITEVYNWLVKINPIFMLIDATSRMTTADITALFTTLLKYLQAAAAYLVKEFGPLFSDIGKLISSLIELQVQVAMIFIEQWKPAITEVMSAIKDLWDFAQPALRLFISLLGAILEGWTAILQYVSSKFIPVIKDAFEGWIIILREVISWIQRIIDFLKQALALMAQVGGGGGGGGGPGANYGAQFYAGEFASGGGFKVGGTNSGRDTTSVAFRANRGERVTVETKKQQRQNDNNRQDAPVVNLMPQINNIIDPSMALEAINTAAGHLTVVNVIKANRDEVAAILGVA